MTPRFCRTVLRTTDVPAAGAFYDAVLGHRADGIVPLPPAALERGAPAHWLGFIDVSGAGGTEAMTARFIGRGATRLGTHGALFRDAGGAVMSLTDEPGESHAHIAWRLLQTHDADGTARRLSDLFGWTLRDAQELGREGRVLPFSYAADEPVAGVIHDLGAFPERHPAWLHFFAVPSLEASMAAVRANGGVVVNSTTAPSGDRLAVCDDAQGAAFGLVERLR